MENNTPATTEKKSPLKLLLEKGKVTGKLTSQEIDQALIDMDIDIEELDKFYETLENQNIELIDDLSNIDLESVDFNMDMPKSAELSTARLRVPSAGFLSRRLYRRR